jgi:hypothetical protein
MQLHSSRNGMHNYTILNTQKTQWTCVPDHETVLREMVQQTDRQTDRHTHTHTHTLTHTRTHTHMPFSTFQYTYYITWLSWTLTQGNVTEKVNGELILVTAHCPVCVSDFEDITFDLLQHMMNGHILQLHHTFVVCCMHKWPSFKIGCQFRIFCTELYA